MKVKTIIILLSIILIIIGLILFNKYSVDKKEPNKLTYKEEKLKLNNLINEIANKYNAVITFRETDNFDRFPYTIEMKEKLMPKDNRLIVISASCSDVVERGDKYIVSFAQGNFNGVCIIFELEASKEQVDKILGNISFGKEYVVIAKIANFEKIKKLTLDEHHEELCTDNWHCYKANGLCIAMIDLY